jgi:hypothetical protein
MTVAEAIEMAQAGELPTGYVGINCPNCGRARVEWDGTLLVCEKCRWDILHDDFYLARRRPYTGVILDEADAQQGTDG